MKNRFRHATTGPHVLEEECQNDKVPTTKAIGISAIYGTAQLDYGTSKTWVVTHGHLFNIDLKVRVTGLSDADALICRCIRRTNYRVRIYKYI